MLVPLHIPFFRHVNRFSAPPGKRGKLSVEFSKFSPTQARRETIPDSNRDERVFSEWCRLIRNRNPSWEGAEKKEEKAKKMRHKTLVDRRDKKCMSMIALDFITRRAQTASLA